MSNALLIVDDTSESLRLLTGILRAEGYNVRSADSGMLALASAFANPPALILLDIRMPGMDGYEVCRRLKSNESTRDIPVIFVSAASDVGERVEGLNLGAVDFITKPYNREELLARVQTHLELSRLRTRLDHLVRERTAELRAANEQLREGEAFQRKFLRDVMANVTDGVLVLCFEESDLPTPLALYGEPKKISAQLRLRDLREWVRGAGKVCGFDEDRIFDLTNGIHEAAKNAIVHVGSGVTSLFVDPAAGLVRASVVDHGSGITLERLPGAAVMKGNTSPGLFGHGIKRMLNLVDRVYLMTGPDGTTVIIEQSRVKPDTWFPPDALQADIGRAAPN